MNANKRTLIIPLLLIAVGIGWLLSVMGIAPSIDWVWTLGLAIVGVLTFIVYGCDKLTFVVGVFFIVTSGLSILRQTERITLDIEIPILVTLLGVLMLIARHPSIPVPKWLLDSSD